MAHKNHPFSKCARVMVLISAICFSFCLVSAISLMFGCDRCVAPTCNECFADIKAAHNITVDIDVTGGHSWFLSAVRLYVGGPCQWCGSTTLYYGGCFSPQAKSSSISEIFVPNPNLCPPTLKIAPGYALPVGIDICSGVKPQSAASGQASVNERLEHDCALSDRSILFLNSTILAVSVFLYERLLKKCGTCPCAYKLRSRERRHRAIFCCCKTVAGTLIFIAVLCGLAFGTAGTAFIFAAQRDWVAAVRAFFVNKVLAWSYGLVLLSGWFFLKRWWRLRKIKADPKVNALITGAQQPLLAPLLSSSSFPDSVEHDEHKDHDNEHEREHEHEHEHEHDNQHDQHEDKPVESPEQDGQEDNNGEEEMDEGKGVEKRDIQAFVEELARQQQQEQQQHQQQQQQQQHHDGPEEVELEHSISSMAGQSEIGRELISRENEDLRRLSQV